jgi:hypothetical protein
MKSQFCTRAKRAHPVPALLAPQAAQVGELHVAPGAHFFLDLLQIVLVAHPIEQDLSVGIARAQHALVKVHRAIGAHQGEQVGAKAAESLVQRPILRMELFGHVDRILGPGQHVGQLALQAVALLGRQQLVHAAWHRTRAMHPLARSDANDFLAELAQEDALPGNLGVGLRHTHDVAFGHLRVKAEQQVG